MKNPQNIPEEAILVRRFRYSHWAPAQRKLNPVWMAVLKFFLAEVNSLGNKAK
jgi:hypothetical protein